MLFGEKAVFAIETGELRRYPGYEGTYCQFRFWIRNQPIGDWDDCIRLDSSAHWMQVLIDHRAHRVAEPVEDESAEAVFQAIYHAFYDQDPFTDQAVPDLRDRHHMDDIGMGAIQDKFGVVVVEETSGQQRVIVKDLRAEMIAADVRLPNATVEEVGRQYICWAKLNGHPNSHHHLSGGA